MRDPLLPLPREDLKEFLQSLSRITGLSMSYVPEGSSAEDLIVGETSFCLQFKGSREGSLKCGAFHRDLLSRATRSGVPEFDVCHARMAEVALPVVTGRGDRYGTVFLGQAVIEGLTDEHRSHIRQLASLTAPDDSDGLVAAAAHSPVISRSRLETTARFIQRQLLEKVSSYGELEDTTEYLFQKYEELMFFYAVAESLNPDGDHRKALTVILDKGVQRLNARWGFSTVLGGEEGSGPELLDTCGKLPWQKGSFPDELLLGIVRGCQGPSIIPGPGFRDDDTVPGTGDILVVPFHLRDNKEGFLVFGWWKKGAIRDPELRFALALSRQAASVLHAVQLYQELADLLFATLGALSSAVDAKDPYTHGHSQRVAEYSVLAARSMDLDSRFITRMKIAGQLHDFGKIGVREHILTKQGRLNDSEMRAMREHPVIGAQILGKFKSFSEIVPGIRHHHEHFDGSGYPSGLKGEEIPVVGRIIAVADAYDAMTTNRPYRARLDAAAAVGELNRWAGRQFDPQVVDAFADVLKEKSS